MSDLSFATKVELIEELQRRHRGTVVILLMDPEKVGEDSTESEYSFSGGFHTALGLVADTYHAILQRRFQKKPAEDENEAH